MGEVHCAIMPYFPAIGQPTAETLRFNGFQMVAVCHLRFMKFEILTGLLWPIRVIVPNFVPIGQTVADIWPIFDFSRRRPSAILDY